MLIFLYYKFSIKAHITTHKIYDQTQCPHLKVTDIKILGHLGDMRHYVIHLPHLTDKKTVMWLKHAFLKELKFGIGK